MGLTLSNTEELRSRFLNLKTAQDVADLLEVDKAHLNYYLYISPSKKRYTTFQIPKKSGGTREIRAPISALKIIQRKLNQVLQQVYKPRKPVHSFIHGESIVKNAKVHVSREWVLNIDLKDFFPTISFQRVRGLFIKKPYEIGEAAATVLAQICCHESKLPQGAPTSPIISNMICSKLDNELHRLAIKHKCKYTRYADDITFSSQAYDFPSALVKNVTQGEIELGNELEGIINDNWFEVNADKVRLRRKNLRQEVTGLVVNEKVNVKRRYVRQIRAMLHSWEKEGLVTAEQEFYNRHYRKYRAPFKNKPSFMQILKGKIEFHGMVVEKNNTTYLRYYRQFRRLCLLKLYEDLKKSKNMKQRGYSLEKLLNQLFKINEIEVTNSFKRNGGAEQIDGAFKIEGWHYLVECKWRKKLSDTAETDVLVMKVKRSGVSTKGFFLSINGWSTNVPTTMKTNPDKATILMNGDDLKHVLMGLVNLREFIIAKDRQLSLKSEPFYGAKAYLSENNKI